MQNGLGPRIEELRAQVGENVAMLNQMDRQFTQPYMKQLVRRARFYFDDIETVFLGMLDRLPMPPEQQAAVIKNAETVFSIATQLTVRLHVILITDGPDAMALASLPTKRL